MKKIFILLAAALLTVACNQEELKSPDGNAAEIPSNGFLAGFEPKSKVALQDDWSLAWEAGDAVAIYNGETFSSYQAQESGATTTLLGEDVGNVAHCAFYPYSDELEFEGTSVTAVIPGKQTPKIGNFPYNPSVAYVAAGNKSLAFYNICGLVGFEITEEETGVSNVVIFGNNNEILTGGIKVDCNSTTPKASVVEGRGVQSVTLQADGVFEPGVYYVAVLPQKFEQGITITMNAPDGKQYKKTSAPFTLNRSHRINASNINDGAFGAENIISNAAELQAFFNVVNADENKGAGMAAKIVADIDMSTIDHFIPAAEFAGTLDGSYTDGENVSNWTISNFNTTTALIGKLAQTGVVKNINVSGSLAINASDDAAFIVLNNEGTISYCKTQGIAETLPDLAFTNARAVGAVAARTTGTIEYCTNEASISLVPADMEGSTSDPVANAQFVGGVVGYAADGGKVSHCINTETAQISYSCANGIKSCACIGGILGATESVAGTSVQTARVTVEESDNAAKVVYNSTGYYSSAFDNPLNIGGVAGYLEGVLSGCNNTGEVYVRGYEHDAENNIKTKVRPLSAGGVAGFSAKIESCRNTGKIDVDITVGATDTGLKYTGHDNSASVGGVVGKSSASTSSCHNEGNMIVDLHMESSNGTSGALGGVAGHAYGSINDCSNKAKLQFTARLADICLAGVIAKTAATSADKLHNLSDDEKEVGLYVSSGETSYGNQAKTVTVGGVIGWDGGTINAMELTNSAPLDVTLNSATDGNQIVGGLVGGMGGSAAITLTGTANNYITNSGSVTVSGKNIDFVGGVVGRVQNCVATTWQYVKNSGDVTVRHTGTNLIEVGGVVARSSTNNNKRTLKYMQNTASIDVESAGDDVRVGGIEGFNNSNASQIQGGSNEGDIRVVTTGSTVYVGGMRGHGNGQINSGAASTGGIDVTTSASTIRLGGLASRDGTTVVNGNVDSDIRLTYTGTDSPAVYASLAHGELAADPKYDGTYGGTISLLGSDGQPLTGDKIYCGMLAGYCAANKTITLNDVSLRRGTVINGVEISEYNYNLDSYLFPNLNGSTVTHTSVNLVD